LEELLWYVQNGTFHCYFYSISIHTISSGINSNKTGTKNFIFNANITQKDLVEFVRYVKPQLH
jgi:hypothetical protein